MTEKTHWPPHPIAELFPRMTAEEREELKRDMQDRVERDVDPLEHPILLCNMQILDGRHRDETWMELAEEGACDGFFDRNLPPTKIVDDQRGALVSWMRAKSLNMVHRHIPADQKVAIFLKAVDTIPGLKEFLRDIEDQNALRIKEGKPLAAGDQGLTTNKSIGQLAGAGSTTVKLVKKVKAASPDKFDEIAQGKTTVKKALASIQKAETTEAPATLQFSESPEAEIDDDSEDEDEEWEEAYEPIVPQPKTDFKTGQVIYQVHVSGLSGFSYSIRTYTITKVTEKSYLTKRGRVSRCDYQYELYGSEEEAKDRWVALANRTIADLQEKLRKGPEFCQG